MSTARTWQTESSSLNDTLKLAEQIGVKLKGGEAIELISDLGGGKTTFVRGLAKGMGSNDIVRSPSFTLSNQYRAGDKTLYHFDFYRLEEPGIMRQELAELLADPLAVVAVEWADIIEDILPVDRLSIKITAKEENSRVIECAYSENLTYLIPVNT